MRILNTIFALLCGLFLSSGLLAKEYVIQSQEEFKPALKKVVPGDVITLKNGTWSDFEIGFFAEGSEQKPVTLRAETPGKVILSGKSNLRLAGNYLVVEGLVFKNGHTPTGEVIAFKRNDSHLANYSRVTQVVIDNFNNPDRDSSDHWVALFGKQNRFDHSYLAGKRNLGATMVVRLINPESQQNHHRIDHNYFGPRPILGSNGGETLRIGTSTYSLTDSHTVVENNYFDRCNGEVEIISVKSGKNIIRNNVFFEARGTLTLRHGNGNLVEGNVFFGNGADHTGGIRVINRDQTIRNNYMEGLTGSRFGSGFAVMNGTVDAPLNRYGQVVNARIENNTFIDVDNIQLGAGSDAERDAPPVSSIMKHNIVYSTKQQDAFTFFDDMSGIDFVGNMLHKVTPPKVSQGFIVENLKMKRNAGGLLVPAANRHKDIGIPASLDPIKKADAGPTWYAKKEDQVSFDSGSVINVPNEEDGLFDAIAAANPGDQLVLAPGTHKISKVLPLSKVITIRASKPGMVVLLPERNNLFEIQNGGALKLVNLTIDGSESPDSAGNILIRTLKCGMYVSYRLIIENTTVKNLNVNHSHHFLVAGGRSLAEEIQIIESNFSNITGDILQLDKESDDLGNYNVEKLTISESHFTNVDGVVANVYRGGTDESTFGPRVIFTQNEVQKAGRGARNKANAVLKFHGVQYSRITTNRFSHTAGIVIEHTVGDPDTEVRGNTFVSVPPLKAAELHTKGESTVIYVENVNR